MKSLSYTTYVDVKLHFLRILLSFMKIFTMYYIFYQNSTLAQ